VAGVLLCIGGIIDGANKDGFSTLQGSAILFVSYVLLTEAASYRISYSLTFGVGRDLSRLTTGCNWDRREDAVEGDGGGSHDGYGVWTC
jgi:hypothetical protein